MTREPAVLRGVIERLTDIATRQEVIGGRTMKTIMSPMKDDTGRRLGTVLEWFDRTQEVATESELHEVIAAVTAGNLENRISLDGKRDFFLTLSRGINELVEAICDGGRRSARRGRRGQPGRPDAAASTPRARRGCWCRSAPASTTSPAASRRWFRR